jgi:ADP-ribosyl-[dinitrogen reductase] hydrolase
MIGSRSPRDRTLGAFLGLACGDALGAPVEFMNRAAVAKQYGTLTEMVGGGSFSWAPGEWTDDTGMALAVAEGILGAPHDPVSGVGKGFLEWVETAKDVGGTISAALANAEFQRDRERPVDPIDWSQASRTTPQALKGKAAGNGSLMRTLPVALAYPTARQMLEISACISAMTHWDPQAEVCCATYCLWVRELLCGVAVREAWEMAIEAARVAVAEGQRSGDTPGPTPLPDPFWPRLEAAPDLGREALQPSGYAGYVVECLEAAVWATANVDSLEEALVTLVNLGGETDTMAAVAGGALGARYGLEAIPERWLAALHQRERIERAAHGLYDLRHELVYAKPTLPKLGFRQLDHQVLHGRNPLTAKDVEALMEAGVTRVIDLREDHEWGRTGKFGREAVAALDWCGIERLTVPIVDGDAPSTDQLDRTWQLLEEAPEDGRTYVHCRAGIERTGAVLAAYLARRDGLSLDEVLANLSASDAGLHPLPFQVEAVRHWLARS